MKFRHRFRIDFEHKGWTFELRVLCGFFIIFIARRWPEWSALRFQSTAQIGFIPLKIKEGQCVPCWTVFKRTFDLLMEKL